LKSNPDELTSITRISYTSVQIRPSGISTSSFRNFCSKVIARSLYK
jgi:hypothetical protein